MNALYVFFIIAFLLEFLLAIVNHNLVGFLDSSYWDFILVVGFQSDMWCQVVNYCTIILLKESVIWRVCGRSLSHLIFSYNRNDFWSEENEMRM